MDGIRRLCSVRICKVHSAIPCALVGQENMFSFIGQLMKKKENKTICNQRCSNLFTELSAFDTNSKPMKAFKVAS